MKKYIDAARNLSPEERGKLLESDSSFTEAHQALAAEGQTDANPEKVNYHFVVFINHNNQLYELDGRKSLPVKHGETTADNLLEVSLSFLFLFNWHLQEILKRKIN